MFSHSKDYLKISIITSLLLTDLGFLTVYLTYSPTSAILTQNILYGGLVIFILSLIYTHIDKIPILKDLIQYDIFRKITNIVFLLPELFKKSKSKGKILSWKINITKENNKIYLENVVFDYSRCGENLPLLNFNNRGEMTHFSFWFYLFFLVIKKKFIFFNFFVSILSNIFTN